ncbi:dihydrodipicolinate synthase family protein [Microbacterium amylolyticum]|uniref:4-hydroxy-tetrahydrodipicolinate synthase n=1 Tax=Microbacterium amylolyticum TaxID=936337 RepID=A0ABS4ZJK4_9MICO|nr:dihydrodipicolinate synthase family protein [Microbacterium amylolyticum]MBP2437467.1 4-hydroxy-tetrahydrodipicolinate synthase [Microbacterium amylolyticum]
MKIAGLSAFPLTPLVDDRLDEESFAAQIVRLARSGVDSIGALGSTGSCVYLSREERHRAIEIAAEMSEGVPLIAGIGAVSTSHVIQHAADAQLAGADALLLAPVSYQPLTEDDVYGLYADVTSATDLPVVVYDNPRTTGFSFSHELYGRVAQLPNVVSIKIPGVPEDPTTARAHVDAIRAIIPSHVTIGVSGDAFAAAGLQAGCDAWYSVLAGTLPEPALRITRAAHRGDDAAATAECARLQPLWDLFAQHGGSIRVVAAIAEHVGRAQRSCLPKPLLGLDDEAREDVTHVITDLGLVP